MVLGWTRPGRVCSRRIPKKKHLHFVSAFYFVKNAKIFAFFKNHQSFWRFQEAKSGLIYDYMLIENKYYQSILTLG